MPLLFHLVAAIFLTVLQIAFLSHLATPFSDISFPLLAITIAIFVDQPVKGALWALVGGIVLDLHGIFPFGTETLALLGILFLTRLLFRRFITNTGLPAAFLFSMVIIAMHTGFLLALDGIRVVFGSEPFIVTADASIIPAMLRMMLVHGLLTVLLLRGWTRLKERFIKRFIIRK